MCTEQEIPRLKLLHYKGIIASLISFIIVALLFILILCNEIYWVENAPGTIKELSWELWLILSPGVIILLALLNSLISHYRSFKQEKSKSEKNNRKGDNSHEELSNIRIDII